jgi:Ser/Thr protein kinase RdoA (MazF antagonist)
VRPARKISDMAGSFDALSPGQVIAAVERVFEVALDGTLFPYPSYINRLYGVRTEEGGEHVAKFYRPGRWSREALLDEQRFLLDYEEADLPVMAPLAGREGDTLAEAMVDADGSDGPATGGGQGFHFALLIKTCNPTMHN